MPEYIFLKADQADEADIKLLRTMLEAYYEIRKDFKCGGLCQRK